MIKVMKVKELIEKLKEFDGELDVSDKEEFSCKISIIEALKELDHVVEYLSKYTLGNTSESYESSK